MDYTQIAIAVACLAAGGILKGATGAGAPILAIPALAMMFDVQTAVVIMVMPNFLPNFMQAWQCRKDRLAHPFVPLMAGFGALGMIPGTFILASLSREALSIIMALAVFAYIGFRFFRPDWVVPYSLGVRLAAPLGFLGGMLQGASGLSAPVSLSFLNSMRLARRTFMATISVFFCTITLMQVVLLAWYGLVTPMMLGLSLLAVLPILAFMPVGALLARRLSRDTFDKIMLTLLAALAIKLLIESVSAL
ncbi:sulfite exporter TauE/SafE family protein [Pararhizobium haloflavum]|uniref:sulfite exporter TauE/SafE family protein n=1 Tax=Pararhizobium haloflavum TaxID=2037914 RepID=UPI000C17E5F2|nr:sulfite exporter TauE/SafE family protein [Pararhizobium haloflavum]